MSGLIAMRNGAENRRALSTDFTQSLKRWLAMFGETFQKGSSLSVLQIKAYEVALGDLSASELNQACEKALRTWTLVAMPTPGFIRKCLQPRVSEQFNGPRQLSYDDSATEEERMAALQSPEYQKLKAQIHLVAQQKQLPKKLRADTDRVVIADPSRLQDLESQKALLRKRGLLR